MINGIKSTYIGKPNFTKSVAKNSYANKKENSKELTSYKELGHLSFLGNKKEFKRVDILNAIRNNEPFSQAGLKGVVYKAKINNKTIAIKVGRDENCDFSNEAKILSKIPKDFNQSQQLIDYFKDPITNCDILVSSFVEGKKGILSSKEDFNNLFKNLFILDKEGILHGDLNMGNFLFDEDKIKLIDYGEGSLFEIGDTYSEMYPNFIAKSNVVNLEQNGIPDFIQKWKDNNIDPKNAFKNYLGAKGEYYKKHSEFLKENNADKKTINFEENYSKVLENPTDKIIKNEILRMDALCTFEQSDTAVNYTKIPNSAIRNWNLTISKVEKMKKNIEKELKNPNLSNEEKIYFSYQKEIANNLLKDFTDWGTSTIDWILGSFKKDEKDLSEHEIVFRKNKNKDMELPPDLYSIIFSK